jgi:hypothetical protein
MSHYEGRILQIWPPRPGCFQGTFLSQDVDFLFKLPFLLSALLVSFVAKFASLSVESQLYLALDFGGHISAPFS